jgi:hypothetical protein
MLLLFRQGHAGTSKPSKPECGDVSMVALATSHSRSGLKRRSRLAAGPCGDDSRKLQAGAVAASAAGAQLKNISEVVTATSTFMQSSADALQPAFGKVGDGAAGASLQAAKKFAGTLQHAAEQGQALVAVIEGLAAKSATVGGPDLEGLTGEMQTAAENAKAYAALLARMTTKATPVTTTDGASKLYYPIMYFVDKAFVDSPSTCGGTPAADPIIGSMDECATACEAAVGKCVGFGYFGSGSLCFLFSKFSSVTYYTGCGSSAFLQTVVASRAAAANTTKCVAKFADFQGTTLEPDLSGTCEGCLKEAKKAARCFE